ncbi:MAG: hypothetical protein O2825_04720 [Proteobacteria bacterium]|nr:hypothetical protein [Pseudomonadota bacterium]
MAGLSPMMLAVVWSAAMVIVCGGATAVVLRSVAPAPGPRLFAFLGVKSIALVFLAVALMVNFVWPEVVGIGAGENRPFLVVAVVFALLVLGLLLVIFLLPVLRSRGGRH